jgi:hypothetical protein
LIRKGVIASRSFAEILAPFREQIASSEISDIDLDSLEEARIDLHAAKLEQK